MPLREYHSLFGSMLAQSQPEPVNAGNLLTYLFGAVAAVLAVVVGIKGLIAKPGEKEPITRKEFDDYRAVMTDNRNQDKLERERLTVRVSESITRQEFETTLAALETSVVRLERYVRGRYGKILGRIGQLRLTIEQTHRQINNDMQANMESMLTKLDEMNQKTTQTSTEIRQLQKQSEQGHRPTQEGSG